MNDQVKVNELRRRIDEVLYYIWDPIGISNEPCARNEYSSYVKPILEYVIAEDISKIESYLNEVEGKRIGLLQNIEKNKIVARRLVQDKKSIQEELS